MATTTLGTVLQNVRRSILRHDDASQTDGTLMDRFITQQDEAAFEALVRRHGPMVLGVCRRVLRNEADAEDAFQATFLVLVRRAGSIRPRGMVGNWLYGVAQNTARKAKAMNTRLRARERKAGARPKPEAAAEDWQQQQELLDQELRALPDKYRAPIVLCDLEGKSIKDAARHLGCPPGTIGTRLARGRSMLAQRLARRGLTLSGGMIAMVLSQKAASASVPLSLAISTVKAASLFAAGQAASGVVGTKVAALTEGVLKTMLLSKLKIGAALLLVFAALGFGAYALSSAPLQAEQPEPKKEGPQEPKPFTAAGKLVDMAWSPPDGHTLVTIGMKQRKDGARLGNCTVQFWDAKTGKEKLSLGEEAETQLGDLAYSPDGKLLALSSYREDKSRVFQKVFSVRVYDAAKGELVREFETHDIGRELAFSPDGKTLATTGEKSEPFKGEFERVVAEVKLWDVATGKMTRLLEDKRELDFFATFNGLAFSPDGKTLATPGIRPEYTKDMVPDKPDLKRPIGPAHAHYEVVLWDLDAGKVKRVLKGESSHFLRSAAFSPDGKFLVAADQQGEVRVWEVATGKPGRTLRCGDGAANCWVNLSPNGKWLAAISGKINKTNDQWEGSVKLWDFRTGEEKQTLPESELKDLGMIVFSPDSKRLAVGVGSTVRIWDIEKAAFEK